MRHLVPNALLTISVAVTGSCIRPAAFPCERDEQCDAGAGEGRCQLPEGYCAYEDAGCEDGFRFESRAPAGLGGQCIEPGSADASTSNGGDSGGSSESTGAPSCGGAFEPCCDESCSGSLVCLGLNCGCGFIVTAGAKHSCLVHADGVTECWGDNADGQLGRVSSANRNPTPAFVEGLPAPFALASADGRDHTCVSNLGGSVYCWGNNDSGQANPDSSADAVNEPYEAATQADFETWGPRLVATGSHHTCVAGFDADAGTNHVSCWGDNALAQLGWPGGEIGEVDTSMWRGELEQIVAGFGHSCALTIEGPGEHHVYCWGWDEFGQLGAGEGDRSGPTPVEAQLPAGSEAVQLSASDFHTCAIVAKDGVRSVSCWGNNDAGQATADGMDTAVVPTPVSGLPDRAWLSVAAGPEATCATSEDDGMWCWGNNTFGNLLPADARATLPPTQIPLLDLGTAAVFPVVGPTHTCAITITGEVLCWGEGSAGQLGPEAPLIPAPDASLLWTVTPTCG